MSTHRDAGRRPIRTAAGGRPWRLYDELLSGIPDDLVVDECLIGLRWTCVRSLGVGLGMTPRGARAATLPGGQIAGMPVKELAGLMASWNDLDACLGVAALNSALNTSAHMDDLRADYEVEASDTNSFYYLRERVAGKKVAVVGHFPGLEFLANECELSILERTPSAGDYPDPACEYLLPDQDFVFITGATLINKTLPRLLELSKDAFVALVGPSVPLSPIFFSHGVDLLGGTVVVDEARLRRVVVEAGAVEIFKNGAQMVQLARKAEGSSVV